MIYTLVGLFFAALSGIAVLTVYGADALVTLPWVDTMFWSIIGTGMLLNFIDNMVSLRGLLCKVLEGLYLLKDLWNAAIGQTGTSELPDICNCNS